MSAAADDRFERRLWFVVAALVAGAFAAHFLADEGVARAARAAALQESAPLQWSTELGEGGWWLIPAGVVFAIAAIRKRHNLARWAFAMIAAVGGSGILVNLLKMAIGKSRPRLLFEEGRLDFSPFSYGHAVNGFPSGHATTCAAAAVILCLALPRWRWLFLPAGFLLAMTRVAIQAHYLSDVCAGFALGAACALLTLRAWRARWPESVPKPA
ncbi:MAG: phosphatase PAP2 family protein [Phycisphaerales bacterium]